MNLALHSPEPLESRIAPATIFAVDDSIGLAATEEVEANTGDITIREIA